VAFVALLGKHWADTLFEEFIVSARSFSGMKQSRPSDPNTNKAETTRCGPEGGK
jgi:hypothetical protein